MQPRNWQQDLFDLMANEAIHLELWGELGEVDGKLEIVDRVRNVVKQEASVIAVETVDEAMRELLDQVA